MTPKQEMRVMIALLAQPLVAAAAAFVLFPGLDYIGRALRSAGRPAGLYQGGSASIDAAVSVAFGAAFAAIFVVVFGALPAIGWVSRQRPLTLGASLTAGAVLGNLPVACILFLGTVRGGIGWTVWPPPVLGFVGPIVFGTLVGLPCGAAFWAIAGAPRVAATLQP